MFTCYSKCYLFTYLAHVSKIFCWYILLLQYMETTNWSNRVNRHVLPFIISVFRALQLWLKHTIAYCEPTYHSLIKKKGSELTSDVWVWCPLSNLILTLTSWSWTLTILQPYSGWFGCFSFHIWEKREKTFYHTLPSILLQMSRVILYVWIIIYYAHMCFWITIYYACMCISIYI